MLKRIFIIAILTGIAQLFVVFALKSISQTSSPEQVKAIGQVDSLVLFIMNVIALGLQPATMRHLALTNAWSQEYSDAQSARFTLSLLLCSFAFLAFIDQYYLAFLIAPLLALSGDYALYGRGFPVKGAFIALARTVIPFLVVMMFIGRADASPSLLFFAGLIVVYLITDILISFSLRQSLIPPVSAASLKKYIDTLPLGLVSLGLYFIGIGIILVAQYFYSAPVLATAFVGLKFYVIFKGVLRIIQQAFLKEMLKEEVCLKVDQLSSLLGMTFFIFMVSFPDPFISFFFGAQYAAHKIYFILTAAAAFIYSIFSSFTTRAMLEKKDNHYAIVTFIAASATLIVCVTLSFFIKSPRSIGISLLVGEILFAIGMLILVGDYRLLKERMLFLFKNCVFIAIPLLAIFLFGPTVLSALGAFFIFSLSLLLYHFNRFNTLLK